MSDKDEVDVFARRFMPLNEFVEQRLRRPCGKPYTAGSLRSLIRADRLPIAQIGEVQFVDLQKLADRMSRDPMFGRGQKRRARVRLDDD